MITFDFEGWCSVYDHPYAYDPKISKDVPDVFVPFVKDYSTDEGGSCVKCDAGIGSHIVDGDYGMPRERFIWMTLVWDGDKVLTYCEECSMEVVSGSEPDREPSAEQERAWNEQYDGTSFGA